MTTETTTEGKMHQNDPSGTRDANLNRFKSEGRIECATPNAADCGLDGDGGEKAVRLSNLTEDWIKQAYGEIMARNRSVPAISAATISSYRAIGEELEQQNAELLKRAETAEAKLETAERERDQVREELVALKQSTVPKLEFYGVNFEDGPTWRCKDCGWIFPATLAVACPICDPNLAITGVREGESL